MDSKFEDVNLKENPSIFPLMMLRRSLDIFSKVDEVGVGLTVKTEVSAYQEFQCQTESAFKEILPKLK